jgi:hypothetical protein
MVDGRAEEVWKQIAEHPLYEVSNLGNVRSFVGNKNEPVTLKQGLATMGYYTVALNGKTKYVHRLVAIAFH